MTIIKRHRQSPIMHRMVEAGGLVFLGGTTADDTSADMKGQTEQILAKLDQFLAEAGSSKRHLVSATIFVTDLSQKPQMDAVWKAWIEPGDLPARATVGVADLGKDTLIEIVVTAAKA